MFLPALTQRSLQSLTPEQIAALRLDVRFISSLPVRQRPVCKA